LYTKYPQALIISLGRLEGARGRGGEVVFDENTTFNGVLLCFKGKN